MQSIADRHIRTVAVLDRCEVYRGQVFHDGHLWEGHSTGDVARYRLDVHTADGSRVLASVAVPHTLEFLYPFGPRSILVVGKHFVRGRGWRTYHSIAGFNAGALRVTTHTMPAHLQIEQFAGRPGLMFFNEPGTRRVFRWTGSRAVPFEHDIRLPGTMLVVPGSLFVHERNRITRGAENVVRIDLADGTLQRTFQQPRGMLSALVALDGYPWIAAVEPEADQVLLIDTRSNALTMTIRVPCAPVDAVQLGRRLIVVGREPKRLMAFDLATRGVPCVADVDLAAIDAEFTIGTVAHVDPRTGNLFLRSPFHPAVDGSVPVVTMVSGRCFHDGIA